MFSYQRKARYHETDQMGVVHHSNYVKWMEESRTEFLESIGAGYAKIEAGGNSVSGGFAFGRVQEPGQV